MKRDLSFFYALLCTPHFVFLTMMLLVGALAGSFTGLRSGQSEGALLESLAAQMVAGAQGGAFWPLTGRALATALAWELAALLAGLLRGHSLFVSAVCAARGFVMAFSAGALLSALKAKGLLLAVLTGGVSAVVTVPCLLLTATAAMLAGQQAGRGGFWYAIKKYRAAVLTCIVLGTFGGGLRAIMTVFAGILPFFWG